MKHALFKQLMNAGADESEILELFEDLKFVFENPFEDAIEVAMLSRGAAYIELSQELPH